MSLVIHTLPVEKYWFMVYNLGVLFGVIYGRSGIYE